MKKELVWLKEVDSTSLQMSLRNLDAAFKNFFEGRADRPKFKSKRDNYRDSTVKFDLYMYQNIDGSTIFVHV
ncbi:hypothetical protein [Oceanirhabdus sp. W0125-5]|nr:hypothetical protein [Oceanirhabdus sp. W0125-5]WBW98673.1 hypothetical protein OW730_07920 [Oceanirhabdus sp. W0125-5]